MESATVSGEMTEHPAPVAEPGGSAWPSVSVIMSVLNEQRHLADTVTAVLGQDYPGDLEVIIACGPSSDHTEQVAAELAAGDARVRVVSNPSGRTPAGLNAAFAVSGMPIIARLDGHGVLAPDYVRTAVQVLRDSGADNVGGIMSAQGSTPFEMAVARAMTSRLGVGNARFHVGGDEGPVDTVYLGVFRREVLQRLGGYDESFQRAQDWELNHRIRKAGGLVWFSPRLRVAYRPRSTARLLAEQYFNYGRWRRVVMRQHPDTRLNARYLAPPALVVALAGAGAFAVLGHAVALVVPGAYGVALIAGAAGIGHDLPVAALVRLPVVLATMHCSWGAGFLLSPPRLGDDGQRTEGSSTDGLAQRP